MTQVPILLDCTLRDGGQFLEYLSRTKDNVESFLDSEKKLIPSLLFSSGISIVEIGGISPNFESLEKFSLYNRLEDISKYKIKVNDNSIIAALYTDPDTPFYEIPYYCSDYVDGVRVILRYSQLQKSLDFCSELSRKGYKVFVQPMLTMRYSKEELDLIIMHSNEINAYALYFVDSFGYMQEDDVKRLFEYFNNSLNPNIKIGFHSHNNMENAFSNVKNFILMNSDRELIVDSCLLGMGQGAGNLQTEVIASYLNKNFNSNLDMSNIFEACDLIYKFKNFDLDTWGYSPFRFIPALYNCSYKYAEVMRRKYGMTLFQINDILSSIPIELKHRYSDINLKKIMFIHTHALKN